MNSKPASPIEASRGQDSTIATTPCTIRAETGLPALRDRRGPYCGINSLYVCLSALGIETEPQAYVNKRFVGSLHGSSATELVDAANHFGANAKCFSHLTHRELKRADTPMILHMRGNRAERSINHWVAFLGYDGEGMRIVDAPRPMHTIRAAELLANWDGSAIAISHGEVNGDFLVDAELDYLISSGLLLLTIYLFGRLFEAPTGGRTALRRFCVKQLVRQTAMIVGLSAVLSLGYHIFSDVGFLRNRAALAEVARRYNSVEVPEISLEEMQAEICSGEALILDARRVIDYHAGALPRAKSMPVDSTLLDRRRVLSGTPKAQHIIVYCQSAQCRYADEVAEFLRFNGYENVSVFREGYRMWRRLTAPEQRIGSDDRATNLQEGGNAK